MGRVSPADVNSLVSHAGPGHAAPGAPEVFAGMKIPRPGIGAEWQSCFSNREKARVSPPASGRTTEDERLAGRHAREKAVEVAGGGGGDLVRGNAKQPSQDGGGLHYHGGLIALAAIG
jgi:hypothetical protein